MPGISSHGAAVHIRRSIHPEAEAGVGVVRQAVIIGIEIVRLIQDHVRRAVTLQIHIRNQGEVHIPAAQAGFVGDGEKLMIRRHKTRRGLNHRLERFLEHKKAARWSMLALMTRL